mmetsp:Transcript_115339/g.200134  ORF Transcript_115339/g.200134 Transcript_115339/m.200134 type:complete len:747 (-) Transcript_115339:13-2253(-)
MQAACIQPGFVVMSLLIFANMLAVSFAATATGREEPVPRVVGLLKHIRDKIEEEGKTEEDLYEKFICWGKSTISTKTASNADAQGRIDVLKQYVSDLDAGAIELTSERVDLNKEIKEVSEGLEAAKSKRDQEHADFLMAEDEMKKAIAALESAINVLGNATEGAKDGVLFALKARVNAGTQLSLAASAAEGATLYHAIEIADKFLHKADALFLRRVLTGEVPDVDWKKLNRKATFKMKYKARSFNIQTTLKKLLSTFTANLNEATAKEATALEEYNTLKGAMDQQLANSKEALTKMEKENGAKTLSRAEASDEISALETQIENDNKYISETQQSMDTKTSEWKDRSKIRADEIEAINKAISILFNDDKRDLFKKSFASQGYAFLQLRLSAAERAHAVLVSKAMQLIAQAGHAARDERLVSFAQNETLVVDSSPVNGTHFDLVLQAIDDMLSHLKDQEVEDLAKKEMCEKDRMADARDAIKASRDMDDLTDEMTRLASEIKEIEQEIATLKEKIAKATAEYNEAKSIRTEENTAYLAAKKDDEEAKDTVVKAKEVLTVFYDSIQTFLLQRKKRQAPGEAPAPPPATWTASYTGKQEEGRGVIAILSLIYEDIEKDISKATKDENAAQAAFDAAETEYLAQKGKDEAQVQSLEGTKGDKETKKGEAESSRGTKFGELKALYSKLEAGEAECNYFTINYPLRRSNRLIEIDGLTKARAILEGGRFTKPKDPNREIKPGDALLQRARRHS